MISSDTMRKILNLFSVPFLEAELPEIDNSYLSSEIYHLFDEMQDKRVLSEYWNDNITTPLNDPSGYSSFNDPAKDLLKNPKFANFYDTIGNVITEFFQHLGFNGDWEYVNSWTAVYPKGAYIARHDHGTAHWSGVYYVACPDANSNVCFDDPKEYSLTNEPQGFKFRGSMGHMFNPVPGKLLVWPSYAKHYSLPNHSEENRIIISFNIHCR